MIENIVNGFLFGTCLSLSICFILSYIELSRHRKNVKSALEHLVNLMLNEIYEGDKK